MLQQLFTWTEANISLLQSLINQGLSGAEIAAQLRCSRNAVIGKAHRLGLQLAGSKGAPLKRSPIEVHASSPKTPWTVERIETASRMWRAGDRIPLIASAVGCSIAALHFQAAKYREQFPKRGYQQPEKVTRPAGNDGSKYVFNADSIPFLLPDFPGVRFIDLEAKHCRWPVSNDHGADMLCCGAPRLHGSYCGVHAMVSRGRGTESERKATSVGRAW